MTWRKQYGSMTVDEAKKLKALEAQNQKLKKLVADLSLDKLALEEMLSKNGDAVAFRFSARPEARRCFANAKCGSGRARQTFVTAARGPRPGFMAQNTASDAQASR